MIEFLVAAYIIFVAARSEGRDWMKIEKASADSIERKDFQALKLVERVRRVTWRMGILGASILATLLFFMRVISHEQWVSTAAASWIVITSVLNFRAYHLEDEGTKVIASVLK
jgi:hypothetical protein